ncbi:gamma carbonic anhydrase family protein [Corynebacterium kalidii]|uniref:Gamma carbonic anhydrase family protein n=1 Tax=Corynebacterium kalidii TaxID=2931982 RepID=A0A9X1WI12_9CORY|nr:gamma carbonic anhydrase family protein [Corynebacterium kalidii]MCJ7858828.1 gamma carbonic anhydrase family protein [Corynebacterium kalidii]
MDIYQNPRTSGPLILPFDGRVPRIHESAYIAPTAVIIGDVEIGPDSSVFYGVVIRADVGAIRIGARTNIQDNSVLHVDTGTSSVLGDDVTVGHQALVHGSRVGDGTLVGMSSSLLSGSSVGAGTLIGAGATVLEGQDVPDGVLAAGLPAKVRRELTPEERTGLVTHAGHYVDIAKAQVPPGDALSIDEVRFS